MRIAISAAGSDANELIYDRFGRSPLFLFCNSEDPINTREYKKNPALFGIDGVGIVVAEFMVKEKVEVLITGRMGRNALKAIHAVNILAYSAPANMTLLQGFAAWEEGQLSQISDSGATLKIVQYP